MNQDLNTSYARVRDESVSALKILLHDAKVPYASSWRSIITKAEDRNNIARLYDGWWHNTMETFRDCFRYSIQVNAPLPEELVVFAKHSNQPINTTDAIASVATQLVKLRTIQMIKKENPEKDEKELSSLMQRISNDSNRQFAELNKMAAAESKRLLGRLMDKGSKKGK